MAWNGSGTFSRTNGDHTGSTTWQTDATEGIKIRSDRHDVHDQDLADGINACLAKNGENSMTGTLKITSGGLLSVQSTAAAYDSTPGDGTYGVYIQADSTGTVHFDSYSSGGNTDLSFGVNSGGGAVSEALAIDSSKNATFTGDITSDGDIQAEATTDDNGFLGYAGATHIFSLTRETNNLKISSFDDIQFWPSATTLGGGSEIAAVTSDGITFNGDTAAANALDDYEEGTWTPVLTDGSNNATHNTQAGTYTKIGRMVHIKCQLGTTSLGSVSGSISISGLPFTSQSDSNSQGTVTFSYGANFSLGAAGYVPGGRVNVNATTITLTVWDASGGVTNMQASEWTASGNGILDAIYYV